MPRVLLLHGVGLDHTMWDEVRRHLPEGLDAHAPDLLGHGTAPAAAAGTTLEDLASYAVEQESAPVHLVGFSLGAMVGQRLSLSHPDLVLSLTCVSSVYERAPAQREAVAARLDRAGTHFEEGVAAALERWFPADRAVDPSVVERTRRVLLASDRASYLATYRVFATADQDLVAPLAGIRAPLLAVTGELDTGSTPEMTERLADAVPRGRARVIPGVGHMLPEERPAELAHLISTFVKEHHHD